MSVSKECPRTAISSGSDKPDNSLAEQGTDSAEPARDSSELLVEGKKEGMEEETNHRGSAKERWTRREKGGRSPCSERCKVCSETIIRLGPVTKVRKKKKREKSFC